MPPPPAPPPAPWTVPAGPAAASTNPWATAAVVLMFIPFLAPLAVASAIVALQQISASGGMQRGRMRSIVVLVVSAVPAFSVVSQLLG